MLRTPLYTILLSSGRPECYRIEWRAESTSIGQPGESLRTAANRTRNYIITGDTLTSQQSIPMWLCDSSNQPTALGLHTFTVGRGVRQRSGGGDFRVT